MQMNWLTANDCHRRRRIVFVLLWGAWATLLVAGGCSDDDSTVGPDAQVDGHLTDSVPHDPFRFPDSSPVDAYLPVCGNGELEEGEVCDDGNTISGDGCNASCTLQDNWDHVAEFYPSGDQNEPAVACHTQSMAAVWTDWSGSDGDGAGIRARFFTPDGVPVDTPNGNDHELTVNQTNSGHQHAPAIALLFGGDYVVAWTDGSGTAGDAGDIRMQRFGPTGERLGGEQLVNTTVAGDQQSPALGVNADGSLLVVWTDGSALGPDTAAYGIKARLFDPTGVPLQNGVSGDASEFQVNQIHTGIQRDPTVCANGSGGFFVAWSDGSGVLDTDGYGIAATVLDATGYPSGPGTDFAVNTTLVGHQLTPAAVLQPTFGPVVVWTDGSQSEDLQEYAIRARLLTPEGTARVNYLSHSDDFAINTTTAGAQELPALASDDAGKLLIVWQDWSGLDGSGSGIRGRGASYNGNLVILDEAPDGGDFGLNSTFLSSQREPAVCNAGQWYAVFWTDESETNPDEEGHAVRYRLVSGW